MKIATWNVNGLRARQAQLLEWLATERPDIVCLQEIKAAIDQLPFELRDLDGYWSCWHGEKGYSGVGLLVSKALTAEPPAFVHPPFDFEQRVATTTVALPGGALTLASVYVPNGGKDYNAKLRFLEALGDWTASQQATGHPLVLCGDLNVTRSDLDIHPKERKPNQVGTRADERALLERVLSYGLVDVARAREPENAELFTWWAPWRNLRQRNIGWRIDYVAASEALLPRVTASTVQREVGTSDHAPVIVEFSEG
ncbi:MAG: exodeoxyribonuclease III [Vicinamibacterales bacterium]|nr:exodeoxyribonuclease III [Vicinamibacterales bacterium]